MNVSRWGSGGSLMSEILCQRVGPRLLSSEHWLYGTRKHLYRLRGSDKADHWSGVVENSWDTRRLAGKLAIDYTEA